MDRPPVWQRLDQYLSQTPVIEPSAYVAPGVTLIGAVTVGARSSIWYQTVVRADLNCVEIGTETNVQDGCVLHVANEFALRIGDGVSCGHQATLHACTIKDHVLVGMGACIMDGSVVGTECIIGARALVPKRTQIAPRSLVLGSPARVIRELTDQEVTGIHALAKKYVAVAARYRDGTFDTGSGPG